MKKSRAKLSRKSSSTVHRRQTLQLVDRCLELALRMVLTATKQLMTLEPARMGGNSWPR
jgi:hypothetical protein